MAKKVAKRKSTKEGVNKSEEIRTALANNPGMGPSDIVKLLADKGIEVTANYVSGLKGKTSKKPKGKPGRKARTQEQIDGAAVDRFAKEARQKAALRNGDAMLLAVELAKEIGVDDAITMLGTLKGIK